MVVYKTKGERVQEAVRILSSLKDNDVRVTDPGFKETKKYLDDWIRLAEPMTYKYTFIRLRKDENHEVYEIKQKGELILPVRIERAATIRLWGGQIETD